MQSADAGAPAVQAGRQGKAGRAHTPEGAKGQRVRKPQKSCSAEGAEGHHEGPEAGGGRRRCLGSRASRTAEGARSQEGRGRGLQAWLTLARTTLPANLV